jgi:hypothetical protein
MKGIVRRFERVMDKYLIPAGFEIQKAQQEYERVLQGKELFDKNIPSLLDNAQNNNERYEILSGLRDYAILNYDDVSVAYKELKDPLMRAVKAARTTEPVSIEATYGNMKGFKADEVTSLVVEIVESLQADVIGTLQLFIDIYRDEPNDDIRKQIENAVKNLSEFNFETYKQVGPMLQMVLVDHLDGMSDVEVDNIRPIAITIWTEAIQSNISGTKRKADSVILSEGSVPASDQLREVRDKVIKALFAAYDRSTNDAQKRIVLSALDTAASTPNHVRYSNELLTITLRDTIQIVNFVMERAKATSYELLQHLEHQFLHNYYCAESFAEDSENRFGCKNEAEMLVAAIIKFRDIINADDQFVRYKILVGFESVYPSHWIDKEFYQKAEEYRREQANCYIDEMGAVNEKNWLDLIERCAKTKSKNLATFPVFGGFISNLAERKPETADRLLAKASDDLRKFLAGFLNGLAQSSQSVIYERILKSELDSAKNLSGVARHLRYSGGKKSDFAARLLKRAIDKDDVIAVNECLLFVLNYYGTEKIADADIFLRDALTFLNDRKDPSWVSEVRFLRKATGSMRN